MISSSVTKEQLVQWRKNHGWGRDFAAKKIGLSTSCMGNYERGRRSSGEIVPVPLVVALAMAAIDAGLKPYASLVVTGDVI